MWWWFIVCWQVLLEIFWIFWIYAWWQLVGTKNRALTFSFQGKNFFNRENLRRWYWGDIGLTHFNQCRLINFTCLIDDIYPIYLSICLSIYLYIYAIVICDCYLCFSSLCILPFPNTNEAEPELETFSSWAFAQALEGPQVHIQTLHFGDPYDEHIWHISLRMRPIFADFACATLGEIPRSTYSQLGSINSSGKAGRHLQSFPGGDAVLVNLPGNAVSPPLTPVIPLAPSIPKTPTTLQPFLHLSRPPTVRSSRATPLAASLGSAFHAHHL